MKTLRMLLLTVLTMLTLNNVASAHYNPSIGRWINRDPIGEEGGVHLMAFVRNRPTSIIDKRGLSEWTDWQWQQFLENHRAQSGRTDIDSLWQAAHKNYLKIDPENDKCWDCEDELKSIMEAFYENYTWGNEKLGTADHFGGFENILGDTDGSILSHFFGGATWGETAQDAWEARRHWPSSGKPTKEDRRQDNAAAYIGDKFFDWIDGLSENNCRKVAKAMADGSVKFTDLLGKGSSWDDVRSGKIDASNFADQQFEKLKRLFGF